MEGDEVRAVVLETIKNIRALSSNPYFSSIDID